MKQILMVILSTAVIIACKKPSPPPGLTSNLYNQTDSTFEIEGKKFKVDVKQFDLTELASKTDTLSRPTYSCSVKISDINDKKLFYDSLMRDSWGYPGKIVSINEYQIAFPQMEFQDSEIVLSFNVFEESDGDAITGFVAFNINTLQARYFWEESTISE